MKIGNCPDCGKIKYLVYDGICASCKDKADREEAEYKERENRIARERDEKIQNHR